MGHYLALAASCRRLWVLLLFEIWSMISFSRSAAPSANLQGVTFMLQLKSVFFCELKAVINQPVSRGISFSE
jgi:hypothetical protein